MTSYTKSNDQLIVDEADELQQDDDDVTEADENLFQRSFSLKEFMILEKAIVEEDVRQSKAKIIVDLGASINTELTEIVDVAPAYGSFMHEEGKVALQKAGHEVQ